LLAYVINWASVWINPIIYVVSQKKYQEAIKHLKDAMQKCGPADKENQMYMPSLEIDSGSKSTEDITRQERTATNKFVQSLKPTKNTDSIHSVSTGYSSGVGSIASND